MSTATSDFPDFFRGEPQANELPLILETGIPRANGAVNYGPFYVGEWDHIALNMTCTAQQLLTLSFAADQAGSQYLSGTYHTIQPGKQNSDVVPVSGPWLFVQQQVFASPGNAATSLTIVARKGGSDWPGNVSSRMLFAGTGQLVFPGTPLILVPTQWSSGPAVLAVDTDATAWTATLDALDYAGNFWATIAKLEHTSTGLPCTIPCVLPAWLGRLVLTNNDGVARTFKYGVTLGS